MVRKEPKTFNEFLTRAHEYIKVDDYLQTRQEYKGEKKRASETEARESKKQKKVTSSSHRTLRRPQSGKDVKIKNKISIVRRICTAARHSREPPVTLLTFLHFARSCLVRRKKKDLLRIGTKRPTTNRHPKKTYYG